jgi:hypothetical protein
VTGRRLDDLGRWAARRDSGGGALDDVSRALVLDHRVSRRGAIGVVSGLVAGAALWPRRARAQSDPCPPDAPKECSIPSVGNDGTVRKIRVCVTDDLQCCNNPAQKCAVACAHSWQDCGGPATCNDTPRLCFAPGGDGGGTKFVFCAETLSSPADSCAPARKQVVGWCCKSGEQCVHTSDQQIGGCKCTGEECGDFCCPKGYACEQNTFSSNQCVKLCEGTNKPRCGATCCTARETCVDGECQCPAPQVKCARGCCRPQDGPKQPDQDTGNPLQNLWNMMQQTSAGHGGSQRSLRALAPEVGATPALLVLGAISGQRAAALGAFSDPTRGRSFTRTVAVPKTSVPAIQAGTGLDARSAAALTALVSAEARASAQLAAVATAAIRSRAAAEKHNRSAARRQLLAAARLSGQAAATLKSVVKLRAAAVVALTAGTQEVIVTPDQVVALQASVRKSGLPADLRALLAGLGVKGTDLDALRTGWLANVTPASFLGGPVLIAPLADAAQIAALQRLISELEHYATRARHHPIARGH